MCLSLADKSITYPLGILENVPTKVGKFVIPADFVVLKIEEDLEIPILFGRLFFMTAGAIIDMRREKITLEVNNVHMELTSVEVASRIDTIEIIDECINEVIHECLEQDPVEPYMVQKANEQIRK